MPREEAIEELAESLQRMMPELSLEEARRQAQQMLDEAEREDAKAHKREQKAAERRRQKEAERLAKPPLTHEDAYWRHYNSNPHPPQSKEGRAWLKENPWFEFNGKRWRRETSPMKSNSGKTIVAWNPTYYAEDGEIVKGFHRAPNRRNDPNRNWGLPE